MMSPPPDGQESGWGKPFTRRPRSQSLLDIPHQHVHAQHSRYTNSMQKRANLREANTAFIRQRKARPGGRDGGWGGGGGANT